MEAGLLENRLKFLGMLTATGSIIRPPLHDDHRVSEVAANVTHSWGWALTYTLQGVLPQHLPSKQMEGRSPK